jgi:cyclic beta-1,2-glucan synthetase
VDSGNLAGHLLTLRAGLLALLDDSILPAQVFSGLSDTFEILADSIDGVAAGSMAEFRKELASASAALPRNLPADRLEPCPARRHFRPAGHSGCRWLQSQGG